MIYHLIYHLIYQCMSASYKRRELSPSLCAPRNYVNSQLSPTIANQRYLTVGGWRGRVMARNLHNDYSLSRGSSSNSSIAHDRWLRAGASFAGCATICADHQRAEYSGCAEVASLQLILISYSHPQDGASTSRSSFLFPRHRHRRLMFDLLLIRSNINA